MLIDTSERVPPLRFELATFLLSHVVPLVGTSLEDQQRDVPLSQEAHFRVSFLPEWAHSFR
jgi:hypothetical protein